jgi:geranylgeranyl diphosphate synthase type II
MVDAYLEELRFPLSSGTAGLGEAMRYSLLAGGKRIRPVLTLATGRASGIAPESLLPTAAAVELIHTYSLIHDDLPAMDDDELRRGRPTSHVVYGEDVAILAGDGLFAEALRLIAESQLGPPERVLRALAELCRATGVDGMVGGQYMDVTLPAASSAPATERPVDAETLRAVDSMKTGRLIAASVGVVLVLAGLAETEAAPYRRYAEEVGVLFQIVDDILDVTGSDEELGKPSGSDQRQDKTTYVSLLGLDGAREIAAAAHRSARTALAEAAGETTDLERITEFIYTRHA